MPFSIRRSACFKRFLDIKTVYYHSCDNEDIESPDIDENGQTFSFISSERYSSVDGKINSAFNFKNNSDATMSMVWAVCPKNVTEMPNGTFYFFFKFEEEELDVGTYDTGNCAIYPFASLYFENTPDEDPENRILASSGGLIQAFPLDEWHFFHATWEYDSDTEETTARAYVDNNLVHQTVDVSLVRGIGFWMFAHLGVHVITLDQIGLIEYVVDDLGCIYNDGDGR